MILLILSITSAAVEWYAEFRDSRKLILVSKPAMMIWLIAWVWVFSDFTNTISNPLGFPLLWFVLGLSFSLLGDVFLMWSDRYFIHGVFAFLIGHIFYILGFGRVFPPSSAYLPGAIVALLVVITGLSIFRRLSTSLDASGRIKMKLPLGAYAVVLSLMLYSALVTLMDNTWSSTPALLVSSGALLFFISDILNIWNRIIEPISNARLYTMVTYHLGQLGIATGAVIHFTQIIS
jgi:uncharacterized membrane protein YhhN